MIYRVAIVFAIIGATASAFAKNPYLLALNIFLVMFNLVLMLNNVN